MPQRPDVHRHCHEARRVVQGRVFDSHNGDVHRRRGASFEAPKIAPAIPHALTVKFTKTSVG